MEDFNLFVWIKCPCEHKLGQNFFSSSEGDFFNELEVSPDVSYNRLPVTHTEKALALKRIKYCRVRC